MSILPTINFVPEIAEVYSNNNTWITNECDFTFDIRINCDIKILPNQSIVTKPGIIIQSSKFFHLYIVPQIPSIVFAHYNELHDLTSLNEESTLTLHNPTSKSVILKRLSVIAEIVANPRTIVPLE